MNVFKLAIFASLFLIGACGLIKEFKAAGGASTVVAASEEKIRR